MGASSLFLPANQLQHIGGGYFWTKKSYSFKRTNHLVYALIVYKYFKYRRYLAYENHPVKKKVWSTLAILASKLPINIENDRMICFEKYIIGGVFDANIDVAINYRNYWMNKFKRIDVHDDCRIIKEVRGIPNNSKIVFVFKNREKKEKLLNFLKRYKIACFEGYSVPKNYAGLKNAKEIEGKIIELPIESEVNNMNYLYKCIEEFFRLTGGN